MVRSGLGNVQDASSTLAQSTKKHSKGSTGLTHRSFYLEVLGLLSQAFESFFVGWSWFRLGLFGSWTVQAATALTEENR
jgi:hypothetical protein